MLGRTHSAPQSSERLAVRRRLGRRRIIIALCIIILTSSVAIVYELGQQGVRIAQVEIFGGDESLAPLALAALQGDYFGLVPRDSIFFYSGSRVRTAIMRAEPNVAAISMYRNGLTGLSIKINDRVPIAEWCGPLTSTADEQCYLFDAGGFIYAVSATSTESVNNFKVYAPLVGDTAAPLGATIRSAGRLPGTFDFARQLSTFGSPVTQVVMRGDEVDVYLESGSRITYVLGNEQNAFTALVSARDNFNLADGSIEYVDLRFDGKVYVKKK